jgi:hypothetical protein
MGKACNTHLGEEGSMGFGVIARKQGTTRRPRPMWEDIRIELGGMVWGSMKWIHQAQDRD